MYSKILYKISPLLDEYVKFYDLVGKEGLCEVLGSMTQEEKNKLPSHDKIINDIKKVYFKVIEPPNQFRKYPLTHVLSIYDIDFHRMEFICSGMVYKHRTRPTEFSNGLKYRFDKYGIIFPLSGFGIKNIKFIEESEYINCIESLVNNNSLGGYKIVKVDEKDRYEIGTFRKNESTFRITE